MVTFFTGNGQVYNHLPKIITISSFLMKLRKNVSRHSVETSMHWFLY